MTINAQPEKQLTITVNACKTFVYIYSISLITKKNIGKGLLLSFS
jgi:hypothetical protein